MFDGLVCVLNKFLSIFFISAIRRGHADKNAANFRAWNSGLSET